MRRSSSFSYIEPSRSKEQVQLPLIWMYNGLSYKQRTLVQSAGQKSITLAIALVIIVLMVMLCHFIVVFSESYSIVSTERNADIGLLELCKKGEASDSPRMRGMCMEATAAQASPIIIKVLTRTILRVVDEIYTMFIAPTRAFSIATLLSIVGVLPWLGTLRAWLWPTTPSTVQNGDNAHTILVMPGRDNASQLHYRKSPPMLEANYDQYSTWEDSGWSSIDLKKRV